MMPPHTTCWACRVCGCSRPARSYTGHKPGLLVLTTHFILEDGRGVGGTPARLGGKSQE